MPRHNGIELGAGSPLLTPRGRKRVLAESEQAIQMRLLARLVGPTFPGQPRGTAGLAVNYPELRLIYAINPNSGGASSRTAAGKNRAMGQLAAMPDLCLPVAACGYHALYVELKRPGEKPTAAQRALHEQLRAAGNAVFWVDSEYEAMAVILAYVGRRADTFATLHATFTRRDAGAASEPRSADETCRGKGEGRSGRRNDPRPKP